MILDGGNCYGALCELDIKPTMTEYSGDNPTHFIWPSNLHRRHLSQGQSASQSWVKAQANSDSDCQKQAPLDTEENTGRSNF